MLINLRKDIFFRGFAFEVFAEKYLRKKYDNWFIFKTNRFGDLNKLIDYYKLDLSRIADLDLIRNHYKSIDIIQFNLRDYKSKIVESLVFYEIKTKNYYRKRPVDISKKTDMGYRELIDRGFVVKLVLMRLLKDWKLEIMEYDYLEFGNVALREKRFLFSYEEDHAK